MYLLTFEKLLVMDATESNSQYILSYNTNQAGREEHIRFPRIDSTLWYQLYFFLVQVVHRGRNVHFHPLSQKQGGGSLLDQHVTR